MRLDMLSANKIETNIELTEKNESVSKKFNFKKIFKGLIIATTIATVSAGAMFANIGYRTGQVYEYNHKYFSKITNYSEMKNQYSHFVYTDEQYKKDTQFFSFFFSKSFPTDNFKRTNNKDEYSLSYTYYANTINELAIKYMSSRGEYKPLNSIIEKFNKNKASKQDAFLIYLHDSWDLRQNNTRIYQELSKKVDNKQYEEYKKITGNSIIDKDYSHSEKEINFTPEGQFYMSFISDNIVDNYNKLMKDNSVPMSFLNIQQYNKIRFTLKEGYKGHPDDGKAVGQDEEAMTNLYKKYNPDFISFREKWNNNNLSEQEKYNFLKTMAFINSLYINNPHISAWSNKIYTPSDSLSEFWNNYYNKKYNISKKDENFYL